MEKKELIEALRAKTGKSISAWAEESRLGRTLVYAAMDGKGTRDARIKIARALKKRPSQIWSERSENVNEYDDYCYKTKFRVR